jgi:hypothetical protein
MEQKPALFGIKHSNRDISKPDSWSKNKFNSTFPASLIAYMDSIGINPVYLKMGENNSISKNYISAENLFLLNPLDDSLFYSFESSYTPFQTLTLNNPPSVDLMLMNHKTSEILAGYEVKLTTLPDESTHNLSEEKYGSEIVIRMPSIHFLACSLASIYKDNRQDLRKYFGKNGFGNISSYTEAAQVNPRIGEIWTIMNNLITDNIDNQKPAIIQPIWKTQGKRPLLADNCLDVFVWSDLAFTKLFMNESATVPLDVTVPVNRPTRALIQLFFMLNEFYIRGNFDSRDIFQKLTYTVKNDKAFAVSGRKTNVLMKCDELLKPRITKNEIKNIILGGGHKLLSPERRFDAVLANSIDLF